jgi:hypothetical protein
MATPAPLSKKLRDTLGPDAGEELMTWLQETRNEVSQFAQWRQELLDAVRASESRMIERTNQLEIRMIERFGATDVRIAEVKADLLKWSCIFWVGAVGAIAALAGVLR